MVSRHRSGAHAGRTSPTPPWRAAFGIGGQSPGQHLESHLSPQLGVLGQVDLAHAAAPELAEDPVAAREHRPVRQRARRVQDLAVGWQRGLSQPDLREARFVGADLSGAKLLEGCGNAGRSIPR